MEETHAVLKQTPKKGGLFVASNQAKPPGKTELIKADSFQKALNAINEILSFEIECLDGSKTKINLTVDSSDDLEINHKAENVKQSGAIQRVPELRRQFMLLRQFQMLSGSITEQKKLILDELLKSERKELLVKYLRSLAFQLRNYKKIEK